MYPSPMHPYTFLLQLQRNVVIYSPKIPYDGELITLQWPPSNIKNIL